jgi:tetratricopeptide (TPR) repeat protein
LKGHELGETFDMAQEIEQKQHFAELKKKYQASQYEDSSPSSHLYKVLKQIDSGEQLSESNINFLKKRKLTDTIAFAVDKNGASLKSTAKSGNPLSQAVTSGQKGRENPITVAPKKHFADLKSKYGVSDYQDNLPSSQLYAILQKLDNEERLEPTDVAWLLAEKIPTRWDEHKLFSGKILKAYHKIEATFYEQAYKRTGNKWNLPSASSHWRGAKKPEHALTQTDNLNFDKIKENKLKSALLTTRGGAFRDIGDLDEAEKCARRAIKYQPSSHHPYTLMGAICFERHERSKYSEGEYWFKEAVKRGASPRDQDAELKRVIKNADKEKRREVVEYLLKTDPVRYEWANTLMGAICYEWGEYSEGEHWFSEAVKRGASPRDIDAEIKRVIKNADKEKRREVVEYLLKTDPVRYKWAK